VVDYILRHYTCEQLVIHLSTNLAEHKLTSLMHVYDVYYLYYYAKPPRDKMYTFQPFNGPLSGTTWMSWYQKGNPIWILLKQETVGGSGINWAICKYAPCPRQVPVPAPPLLNFLQARCPSCHPTTSVKALKAYISVKSKKMVKRF